ncbi:MAG: ISAs1 family transposase [Planctomycetaceae bacterium]|nr:MAG: ISAs1 family transposase [Planctomycetaceae bacterium]
MEIWRCWTIADPVAFEYIRHYEGWADLHSIIRIERERRIADTVERDLHFYISSLPANAPLVLHAVPQHWTVENNLHWVLDVVFREDEARLRSGHAAQNMAVVRHMALNILKRDPSNGSLAQKRYRAALDDAFLLTLLSQL